MHEFITDTLSKSHVQWGEILSITGISEKIILICDFFQHSTNNLKLLILIIFAIYFKLHEVNTQPMGKLRVSFHKLRVSFCKLVITYV